MYLIFCVCIIFLYDVNSLPTYNNNIVYILYILYSNIIVYTKLRVCDILQRGGSRSHCPVGC